MTSPVFQFEMKVRDYECDSQGIVNNANYQHYYEATRHEFLESCGLNFYELHNEGIDAVVASVYIKYKNSLYGMDRFICSIERIERKGIRYIFHQQIKRVSDDKICSEAQIEVVNLVNGKLAKPEFFDKVFAKYM